MRKVVLLTATLLFLGACDKHSIPKPGSADSTPVEASSDSAPAAVSSDSMPNDGCFVSELGGGMLKISAPKDPSGNTSCDQDTSAQALGIYLGKHSSLYARNIISDNEGIIRSAYVLPSSTRK